MNGWNISKWVKCQLRTTHLQPSFDEQNWQKCWKVYQAVWEDHCLTIEELVETTVMWWSSFEHILTEDEPVCKICAPFSHREQKQKHMDVCCDVLEELNDHAFLEIFVTGDETWCYAFGSHQIHLGQKCTASSLQCEDNVDSCFNYNGIVAMNLFLQDKL